MTAAAAAPVFMQDFLTNFGPLVQILGFLGLFFLGLAAIATAVALFMMAARMKRIANDYRRYVDSVAGPAPVETAEKAEEKKDVAVDEFVE
jgi:hypothetical protein